MVETDSIIIFLIRLRNLGNGTFVALFRRALIIGNRAHIGGLRATLHPEIQEHRETNRTSEDRREHQGAKHSLPADKRAQHREQFYIAHSHTRFFHQEDGNPVQPEKHGKSEYDTKNGIKGVGNQQGFVAH